MPMVYNAYVKVHGCSSGLGRGFPCDTSSIGTLTIDFQILSAEARRITDFFVKSSQSWVPGWAACCLRFSDGGQCQGM